ncbi:YSIRK-type signal peptide-containing protein [Staphylococcus condimenti]|uniref:YSIRK-type signal peptide-containing protein n=1 Tax=Staphylococcus condimenti TaxID=70255 RepID=A0A4Q7CT69_9STAP|nr:YSIRK-type signal peptide-containing protein [Staphylococcus condimenti]RZI04943.1 YSIRK-type signal peptide-containing protein [Staphylococcus condimenti]RZI05846.1 YSIRK-type signal peptide-containing protein [Staphylococcus condimenti]
MKKRQNHFDFLPNIRNKYSIRKFSVGTASIIVSSLFFLGYSHEASASTENINPDTTVLSPDHQTSDSAPQNAQPAQGSIEENPKEVTADEINPNLTSANLNATGTTTNPTQNSSNIQEDKTVTSNKVKNTSDNPGIALKTTDSTKPAIPAQDIAQSEPQKEVAADTNDTESSPNEKQNTHQNVEVDNNQSQSSNEAAINNPTPKTDVTVSNPQTQTPDSTSQSAKLSNSSTNATDEMIGPDPAIQTNVSKASELSSLSKEQVNNINHQITWLDFSDTSAVSNYGQSDTGQMALQVGTKYEKEIMPGLVVTATVKSLQPFEATSIYERRAEGDADSGYNPKATNIVRKDAHDDEIDKPAYVVVTKQDSNWSHLKKAGVDTGEGLTNFGSNRNYGNVGATFEVKTTYNGQEVPANIVMSDGEEAKNIEALIYTTNGSGWELFANVKNEGNPENYHPITADDGYFIDSIDKGEHGKGKYYVSPDKNFGGLGTQIFGPNQTRQDHNSVPIVVTTGATEVSFFVNSTGIQTVQMGFVILDKGDAPSSYGEAIHAITETANVSQPFLGTQKADIDFDEQNKQAIDWQTDDINTPTSAKAADEGEQQLVGENQKYTVYNAADQTYALDIIANTGNNDTSYVRGWVDFNHNGVFDSNEASELVSLNRTGDEGKKITLLFNNAPQVTDTSLNYLGVRVRTSLAEDSVSLPNGVAYSGEVEDFEIKVIHPPRGEKSETTGLQGQIQTSKAVFNAFGRVDKDWPKENAIDTVKAIQIVDTDGNLVSSLSVPGEGQYDVAPGGTITFTPDPQFKGTAKGIVLRATDLNGNTSGWTSNTDENNLENINQGINGKTTMDAVYIPTVTPVTPTAEPAETTGLQGQKQAGTPTFEGGDPSVPINETIAPQLIDPNTGSKVSKLTIPNEGTYITNNDGTITFTPEPQFTGKASSITVERVDTNGTAIQTTYTPTVTPVTPVGTSVTSEGPQGQPQEGTPTFEGGNPSVPIDENVPPQLIDPNTGNEVDKVVIPDEGTYTIDPNGKITFTPEPHFIGDGSTIKVKRFDKNGTPVTATYTPNVSAVIPTAEPSESTGLQGQKQTGTPTFKEGHPLVPIDENSAPKLIDPNTGDKVSELTITHEGTYIANNDGTITFIPESQFTGKGTPITVERVDTNGTTVQTTYTPNVTPATPVGTSVTSEGPQGQPQEGTPTFEGGNPLIPIDETIPPKLIDPNNGDEVDKVNVPDEGTYTIDPNGKITFTPIPHFTGETKGIEVKRVDKNNTPVTATYTPKVTVVTPIGIPDISEGLQGQPQEGTPTFEGGNPLIPIDETVPPKLIDPNTGDEVDKVIVPDEGTYTIDPVGKITFTPVPHFTGDGSSVEVKRVDKNGTSVTAKYTPHVTPVTAEEQPPSTTDNQNHIQEKPVIKDKQPLKPTVQNIDPEPNAPITHEAVKNVVVSNENTSNVPTPNQDTSLQKANLIKKEKHTSISHIHPNDKVIATTDIPTVQHVKNPLTPEESYVSEKIALEKTNLESTIISVQPSEELHLQTPHKIKIEQKSAQNTPENKVNSLPQTGVQNSNTRTLLFGATLVLFGLAAFSRRKKENKS